MKPRENRLIQAQQNQHLLHSSCTVKSAANPSFENVSALNLIYYQVYKHKRQTIK